MKLYSFILCLLIPVVLSCGKDDKKTLEVSVNSVICDPGGGAKTVEVTSNTDWVISTGSGWYRIEPASGKGNGTITITTDPNGTGKERTGNFYVTALSAGLNEEVIFTQAALPETITD